MSKKMPFMPQYSRKGRMVGDGISNTIDVRIAESNFRVKGEAASHRGNYGIFMCGDDRLFPTWQSSIREAESGFANNLITRPSLRSPSLHSQS